MKITRIAAWVWLFIAGSLIILNLVFPTGNEIPIHISSVGALIISNVYIAVSLNE